MHSPSFFGGHFVRPSKNAARPVHLRQPALFTPLRRGSQTGDGITEGATQQVPAKRQHRGSETQRVMGCKNQNRKESVMGEKQKVVIPAGTISRAQAEAIAAAYINADIEDDKGTHFRVVVRVNGEMVWSVWNFE